MATVGQVIRARRESLGLTLQALADAVGSTKSYLSMIENHRVPNPPSLEILEALEEALGITNGELLRTADWQSTPRSVRRELERKVDRAREGEELAKWLAEATSRRGDGAKSLDKLVRSGELRKRVSAFLGEKPGAKSRGKRKRSTLDKQIPVRYQVPLINRVSAGYPRDFTDLEYPARIADEYVSVPDLMDPNAFAARVVGDSMEPDYREGDIVVFSPAAEVKDGSDCFVRLDPDQETTFKRVFFESGRAKAVRLQPLNPKFAPRVLKRSEISGLYKAVWRFAQLP